MAYEYYELFSNITEGCPSGRPLFFRSQRNNPTKYLEYIALKIFIKFYIVKII